MCTYTTALPSSKETYARRVPSADNAIKDAQVLGPNWLPLIGIVNRVTGRGLVGAGFNVHTAPAPIAMPRMATAAARRQPMVRRIADGPAAAPAANPTSRAQRSCSRTSCAVWNRSSGFFARQVRTR